MELDFKINWFLNGAEKPEIEQALFQILRAVRTKGSLRSSAASAGLSYRHAWGMIKKWENQFNSPLLILERGRGHGARLTDFGEKLISAEQRLEEQLQLNLLPLRQELNQSLSRYLKPGTHHKIRLFASHGMAVTYLRELLEETGLFEIDFQIHGSLESLQYLNSGHCQIAGFHLPLQIVDKIVLPTYKNLLVKGSHSLLKVAMREQGLIVKKGNPKNILELSDLARRSVRFINRQKNSGTRTIFDQLIKLEHIKPGSINGYSNEEFTHVAVAAMIASGYADAGFGIAAAAEQFDLDFIPYLQEAYILGFDNGVNPGVLKHIKKTLKSEKFRNEINRLAGYNADESGKELSFNQLFGET